MQYAALRYCTPPNDFTRVGFILEIALVFPFPRAEGKGEGGMQDLAKL